MAFIINRKQHTPNLVILYSTLYSLMQFFFFLEFVNSYLSFTLWLQTYLLWEDFFILSSTKNSTLEPLQQYNYAFL